MIDLICLKFRTLLNAQSTEVARGDVMPSLKAEPAGRLRSIGEFFALARAMEASAVRRYTQTAQALRKQNVLALADTFDALSKVESEHVERIIERAAEHGIGAVDTEAPWPMPDTFDVSPEEIAQSRLMTPYRAFALAVRHEERLFAFWTYVAAHAEGEIKHAAEQSAREELEHVSSLRQQRREAYHAERQAAAAEGVTLSKLGAAERRLAELIEEHYSRMPPAVDAAALALASRNSADRLYALEEVAQPKFSTMGVPAGREKDIAALSEYLAEAYLRLAESARNEDVLVAAQELATSAIGRLGKINAMKAF
jgi:rubrerythrin